METNPIIEKVRHLLKLAKSSNANEAANAAAAANKLIDRHRISEDELNDSSPIIRDTVPIYETGRVIPWKSSLANILAAHYGCACVNLTDRSSGRQYSRYTLVGRKEDLEITRYMFTWLEAECHRLSSEVKGQGHIAVFSWCRGFVAGVAHQLSLSRAEVKQESTETAIVKLDNRLEESKKEMYNIFPDITKAPPSKSRYDYDAYNRGIIKGKSISIGNKLNK